MKKENFILKIYSITMTLILGFILVSGFKSSNSSQKFAEITVERINIVEPDGKLKMVISNKERQHPGMFEGKNFDDRERASGIIFFNEEQDEVGGLIFSGNKEEGANFVLSVDQYKNDQIMQLMQYSNKNGDNRYGLQLWERDKDLTMPLLNVVMDSLEKEGYNYQQKLEYMKSRNGGEPITEPRLFIGKNYNRETGLFIQDKYGIDRLRFYVDSDNSPKIEVLDEKGKIIKSL
jgi:hypothetical protein